MPKEITTLWVIPCQLPPEILKLDSVPFRMRFQPWILGCVFACVSIEEAAYKPIDPVRARENMYAPQGWKRPK